MRLVSESHGFTSLRAVAERSVRIASLMPCSAIQRLTMRRLAPRDARRRPPSSGRHRRGRTPGTVPSDNRERAGAASRRDALSGNGQGRRRVAPRRVDRRPPVRTIRLTADASSRSRPTQDGHLHRLRGQERSSLRAVPRPPLHRVTSGDAQPCGQSLALM